MIKINLAGTGRRETVKGSGGIPARAAKATRALLFMMALGTAAGGYSWYFRLATQNADLRTRIDEAKKQKTALERIIKEDQVYEARQKALARRVAAIRALQRNQVSPIVSLDVLSHAVERTEHVWLSSLDQNNAALKMSGIGTSLGAIADFETNLRATGYFRNIDLVHASAQDNQGYFAFSMNCLFSPPHPAAPSPPPPAGDD